MQTFELIVIHDQVKDRSRLEKLRFGTLLAFITAYTIHDIRLRTEQLRENGHDQAGFAVLHAAQNNASGMV